MDHFQFILEKEKISKMTKVGELKKVFTTYWHQVDRNYNSQTCNDWCSVNSSIESMARRLLLKKLCETARERYTELGFDLTKLPQYAQKLSFNVEVLMTLEQAHDWVKTNQPPW